MQSNGKIRIAIQKSGRLSEESISLLGQMGLRFETYQDRLFAPCRDMPIDVLFLRDDDIPEYVQDGVADLGIVGSNVLDERMVRVERLLPLDFGFCSLCLAVPERGGYESVEDLNGKRIATSYPETLRRFLLERRVEAEIVVLGGCVEIAPALKVADAICDLVSTGSTLRTHGLTILETVARCQAVLFGRQDPPEDSSPLKKGATAGLSSSAGRNPRGNTAGQASSGTRTLGNRREESRELIQRLLLRAQAVQEARKYRYVMFNAPADAVDSIKNLLPGCKSPTIVPLADPGFIAVHAMVLEETFWEVVEKLRDRGASDILVTPVEKFMR